MWLNGVEEEIVSGGRTERCLEEMRKLRKGVEVSFWTGFGAVDSWVEVEVDVDKGWRRDGRVRMYGTMIDWYM